MMPNCPKCGKNGYVRYSWCGKYFCERNFCNWVFGKIPNTTSEVAEDQYCWWIKS
jgi:hypothetical protein